MPSERKTAVESIEVPRCDHRAGPGEMAPRLAAQVRNGQAAGGPGCEVGGALRLGLCCVLTPQGGLGKLNNLSEAPGSIKARTQAVFSLGRTTFSCTSRLSPPGDTIHTSEQLELRRGSVWHLLSAHLLLCRCCRYTLEAACFWKSLFVSCQAPPVARTPLGVLGREHPNW